MKTFKQILSVIFTIMLFCVMFYTANYILMLKWSIQHHKPFFKNTQRFDVVFFGSSHMYNAISPLDMFHKYGIASYNFGSPGNGLISIYFQLEELADSYPDKLPPVVVIDIADTNGDLGQAHKAWDAFSFGLNKWQMTYTKHKRKDRFEIMFPFAVYHTRWNEALKELDYTPNQLYGHGALYTVQTPKEILKDRNSKKEYQSIKYLEKIRNFCNQHSIELVLINIPYTERIDRQQQANAVYDIASKWGITYVNYINENIGLDTVIDYANPGHLNVSGMRLFTYAIGKLLHEKGLPDRRKEPIAKRWNADYNKYIDIRINQIKKLNNISEFLMACNDPDLTADIYINGELLQYERIVKLIKRLENNGCNVHLNFGKVAYKKDKDKTVNCDLSAVVFRKGKDKKEIYRTGFNWNRQSFSKLN